MNELAKDLRDKADKARYHDVFLEPAKQAEYFDGAAQVVEEWIDDNNFEEEPEDYSDVHQHLANELMKLIDDLNDKSLKITRTGLVVRVGALRKYLRENTDVS